MTLPSNCISTEPSGAPNSLPAGSGVSAQSSGGAPTGMPFANLLTQADAAGANAIAPAVDAAPNSPVSVASSGAQMADSNAQTTGAVAPQAGTAGSLQPDVGTNAAYSCLYYTYPAGSPAHSMNGQPSTPAPAQPALVVVQTAVAADASVATGTAPEKPVSPCISGPKEKPKTPSKPDETAASTASPEAQALAYQFIAGQWVAQQSVQQPTPAQPSTFSTDAQSGADLVPAASLQTSGVAMGQNNQPTPKSQKAALAAIYPADTQKKAGEAAGQILANVAPAGTDAAAAPEMKPAALPENATSPADRATRESTPAGDGTAVVSSSVSPAEDAKSQNLIGHAGQVLSSLTQAQEKIAAPAQASRTDSSSGVITSSGTKEKKSLSINGKSLTSDATQVGTSAANREFAMPYSAVNKTPAAVLPSIGGAGIQAQSQNDNSAVAQTTASFSAQAPKLVEEIRQIADRISAVDRNTVEVRFDFGDRENLSVRVEYRDGTVHTTFRTDSSQLRDAISHEWQVQSATNEQRPYRISEPVFSQTTSHRQDFPSSGDGSGRERAFEQPAQTAPRSYAAGRSTSAAPSAAVPAARSSHPETSRHLHALA